MTHPLFWECLHSRDLPYTSIIERVAVVFRKAARRNLGQLLVCRASREGRRRRRRNEEEEAEGGGRGGGGGGGGEGWILWHGHRCC